MCIEISNCLVCLTPAAFWTFGFKYLAKFLRIGVSILLLYHWACSVPALFCRFSEIYFIYFLFFWNDGVRVKDLSMSVLHIKLNKHHTNVSHKLLLFLKCLLKVTKSSSKSHVFWDSLNIKRRKNKRRMIETEFLKYTRCNKTRHWNKCTGK